jgi:phenylpyruvate tautomerase PptA (4-oxalocrotonate tautomerase family)
MPLLKLTTNRELDPAQREALMTSLSRTVAELTAKPERYVMVAVEDRQTMMFAAKKDPLAYLEMKSIGLNEENTPLYSRTLSNIIHTALEIPEDRIYIEFANAAGHLWGWNGDTF